MISIIVAVAEGGVIGGDNTLLWHISEDLKRFKTLTTGHPIIMGRKTYESIGRPLPNRDNIVISRDPELKIEGCIVVGSLAEAIDMYHDHEECFVIGGGEIYKQAIGIADYLYITHVRHKYEGDTYFPEIDRSQWFFVCGESYQRGESYEYPFDFEEYERIS